MRSIDYLIDYVRTLTYPQMSETEKQVVINRLDKPPSPEEINAAKRTLGHDGKAVNPDGNA